MYVKLRGHAWTNGKLSSPHNIQPGCLHFLRFMMSYDVTWGIPSHNNQQPFRNTELLTQTWSHCNLLGMAFPSRQARFMSITLEKIKLLKPAQLAFSTKKQVRYEFPMLFQVMWCGVWCVCVFFFSNQVADFKGWKSGNLSNPIFPPSDSPYPVSHQADH